MRSFFNLWVSSDESVWLPPEKQIAESGKIIAAPSTAEYLKKKAGTYSSMADARHSLTVTFLTKYSPESDYLSLD